MTTNLANVELQARDLALFDDLRNLTVLSLDQIRRLHWPNASREMCRKRLSRLMNHGEQWLANFTVSKPQMTATGLQPGQVYHLSQGGRAWFRGQERPPGRLPRRRQALHDLLISEWFVRLSELARARRADLDWRPDWQIRFYRRPDDDRATLVPDGLAILTGLAPQPLAFFLELDFSREAHSRPSSRIGRKIKGYDQFLKQWTTHSALADLPHFPAVLFLTHGRQRLENLVDSLLKHRRGPVAYALALTDQLWQAEDPLSAPLWRLVPANSRTVSPASSLLDQTWLPALQHNRRAPVRTAAAPASKPTPAPKPQPVQKATASSPASKAAASPPKKPASKPVPAPASQPAAAPPQKPSGLPVQRPAPSQPRPSQPRPSQPWLGQQHPNAPADLLSRSPDSPSSPAAVDPPAHLLGKIRKQARRFATRLAGLPETGKIWADELLRTSFEAGVDVDWQPLPEPAQALFRKMAYLPAGLLVLDGQPHFYDDQFTRVGVVAEQLAAYRELAYVWTEAQLPLSWPERILVVATNSDHVAQICAALLTHRRRNSFCLTTTAQLKTTSAPVLAPIWWILPALHPAGKTLPPPQSLLS